jgi:hypothetical protein
VGKNSGNDFVEAFVLAEGLAEHAPKRDERTEHARAVSVAFGFQNAQNVLTAEQPTERQAAIVGKLVTDDAKVSAWHGGVVCLLCDESARLELTLLSGGNV